MVVGDMYECTPNCRSCLYSPLEKVPIEFSNNLLKAYPNKNTQIGIDVGAHVGMYGIGMQKTINKMYSFEPNEDAFKALEKNKHFADNIIPYKVAVSNVDTDIFFSGDKNRGNGIAYTDTAKIEQKDMYKTKVKSIIMDNFLPQSIVPSFIKIDIKGGEIDALKGMKRIISGTNNLIMILEVCKQHLAYFNYTIVDFIDIINYFNFRMINTDEQQLHKLGPIDVFNCILVKGY